MKAFGATENREFDMDAYQRRYVALEVFYLGWRYHGFASQADSEETVEVRLLSLYDEQLIRMSSRQMLHQDWNGNFEQPNVCYYRVTCSAPCAERSSSQKVLAGKAWDTPDVDAQTKASVHSDRWSFCWSNALTMAGYKPFCFSRQHECRADSGI